MDQELTPSSLLYLLTAEGTTFGIVPFVQPNYTASVTGIVGAGGNVGAVLFTLCFRYLSFQKVFSLMGSAAFVSALWSVFIHVDGYGGMLSGRDRRRDRDAEHDENNADEDPTHSDTGRSTLLGK
jgi:nitrate/nitrite transporter NarK